MPSAPAETSACGLAIPKDGKLRVPNSAFRFDTGDPFEFADADDQGRIPVTLAARSAKPISHWYWGKIAHDMAGFRADGPRVPIDYDHWEAIGFANKFDADPAKGLSLGGEIHTLAAGDTVDTVRKRSKLGTPYQASIFFATEKLEYVERGETAEVNGYQLKGPAIIVREWRLRGVAITLYGADHRTKTKFSERDAGETEVELFSSNSASACGLATMPTENANPAATSSNDTTNLSAGAATTPPTQASAASPGALKQGEPGASATGPTREQFASDLKKYTDKFGAENGVKWFSESKSYEEALELHAAALSEKLTAETAKSAGLETKLGQVNRGGEATALSATDAEKPPAGQTDKGTNEFTAKVGSNLGAFAASLKKAS